MDEKPEEIGIEQHYTPAQIAKKLALSVSKVVELLKKEPGVFCLGREGLERTRLTLRASETVVKRMLERYSIKPEYGQQKRRLRVLRNDR